MTGARRSSCSICGTGGGAPCARPRPRGFPAISDLRRRQLSRRQLRMPHRFLPPILAAIALAFVFVAPARANEAADKQRALQAIQAGDFPTALAVFKPLAD